MKDSFGVAVNVGDYVVFATKGRYLGSLGIGRINKINPGKSISLAAIFPYGQTLEEAVAAGEEARIKSLEWYHKHGHAIPDDLKDPFTVANLVNRKQRLDSASTCYVVPAHILPPIVTQLLQD